MSIRVGLVGYGNSAKVFHCPLIASTPSLEWVAVVQRHHPCPPQPTVKVYSTAEEMFQTDIDLVVITTPNASHYSLVLLAMQYNKHVVVEKPFTITSEEACELVRVSSEKQLVCSVYQNRRWDGDFLTVKELVDNNRLGRIVELESHFDRYRPLGKAGWREDPETVGSGMLYDLGSHLIDQALCLFGMPKTVYALLENERQIKGKDIIDSFILILGYDHALKATLRSSVLVCDECPVRFLLRGTQGAYKIHGLDVQENQLKQGILPTHSGYGINRPGLLTMDTALDYPTQQGDYGAFYENVSQAILNKTPLAVSAQDGMNCIRIIEYALQSHREERTVHVTE